MYRWIYYLAIEDKITNYYDLGYAYSFKFMEVGLRIYSGYFIYQL